MSVVSLLAEIPEPQFVATDDFRHGLAHWIAFAQQCASQTDDYWQALEWLFANEDFARIDAVHTLNNTAVCVLALLYSSTDMEAAVCKAFMGGLDTDRNGATVGSIVAPMHERLFGFHGRPLAGHHETPCFRFH